MDLADAGGSERVQVDFFEVLLPVLAVFADEVLGDLLQGHDVSFRTGFLHCVTDDWREDRLFACAQDLTDLKCSSSHLLEIVCESLSIFLIESILGDSFDILLILLLSFQTNFLLECLSHGSAEELNTQHTEVHRSGGWTARHVPFLGRELGPVLAHVERCVIAVFLFLLVLTLTKCTLTSF